MAICISSSTHFPSVYPSKFRLGCCSNLSYVKPNKIFLVLNCRSRSKCNRPFSFKTASLASSSVQQLTGVETEEKKFPKLREICEGHVPEHVISRMEEIGYILPTDVQRESLPVLFAGQDCILHAQTGSGKTLAYLLQVFSEINPQKFGVQALIILPTRELGMQVTEVARRLAAKPLESEPKQKSCTVMALLDGGTLNRHKKWLKAEPPTIIVATLGSLSLMLEKQLFRLETIRVLVVDEVDFMFNSSKQVDSLRRLLTLFSSNSNRQTIFASASVPQPKRFLYDCIQHKWTKRDVVHVHVNALKPMPSCLHHRFVICGKRDKHQTLLSLLHSDAPRSAIVFVGEQSEKSKKAGNSPPLELLVDFLKVSYMGGSKLIVLGEDINFNQRATTLLDVRGGGDYLLVATDIAARGVDLPETTHIYNFDLPRDVVNYLHRAGRTGHLLWVSH
ncbi:OLC1v1020146C1 [Oldenlandia corymbosa var. corymbosa]|uniref:RNA helicase n=1 Tax=Oldenlandia corymbosa var. corymbosa TaxID=529605 RepID=A0AAV1EFY3_OLDCO|nr:OLC1v1020146C1 [Oldenlandia corymbosa var. corymbosa]